MGAHNTTSIVFSTLAIHSLVVTSIYKEGLLFTGMTTETVQQAQDDDNTTRLLEASENELLTPEEEKVFLSFWKERFGNDMSFTYGSYPEEWARRIKNRKAWIHADKDSRQALTKAGYTAIANSVFGVSA